MSLFCFFREEVVRSVSKGFGVKFFACRTRLVLYFEVEGVIPLSLFRCPALSSGKKRHQVGAPGFWRVLGLSAQ